MKLLKDWKYYDLKSIVQNRKHWSGTLTNGLDEKACRSIFLKLVACTDAGDMYDIDYDKLDAMTEDDLKLLIAKERLRKSAREQIKPMYLLEYVVKNPDGSFEKIEDTVTTNAKGYFNDIHGQVRNINECTIIERIQ